MKRLLISVSVLLAFAATLACCDKDGNKEAPPAAKQKAVEPASAPEPAAPEKPEPKLTKKKLSEIDSFGYMDILEAAGWTDASSGGMAMGAWEQTTIKAKQGDKQAVVTIVAPTGKKDEPNASVKVQTPEQQLPGLQEKGAAELLTDDVVLGVSIEGDPEGAKKLLEHIKSWIVVD